MRIDRTFGQLIAGFQVRAVKYFDPRAVWDNIGFGFSCLIVCNDDLTFFFGLFYLGVSANLRDDRKTLRLTCLEKLLHTRKTLCDIVTGYAAGMESTHGKLCTRLTDGLCGDDTDCLSDLHGLTGCQVGAVTFGAGA